MEAQLRQDKIKDYPQTLYWGEHILEYQNERKGINIGIRPTTLISEPKYI